MASLLDPTLDVTPRTGMDLRSLPKTAGPAFLQNIVPSNGELAARPGFGTVREYGTTLNAGRAIAIGRATAYGLGRCIGAKHVRTPWGTDQILAIHPVYAFTGNYKGNDTTTLSGRRAVYLQGVSAFVHDLHTGRVCEFVLHEQDATTDDLRGVFPNYAMRLDRECARWAAAARAPEWAVFAAIGQAVVVGIDGMGLWTYRPVEFPARPDRKAWALDREPLGNAPGEQAAMSPLNLSDGVFASDNIQYLRQVEFGQLASMCAFNDRMVYATSSTVYFSDPLRPDNVMVDNFLALPTTDPIVLVRQNKDGLVIATQRQSWLFSPTFGQAAVGGSLIMLSASVGCAGNMAVAESDASVFFASQSGVQFYTGGTSLRSLSAEVDRLWTDPQSLQMPLTDYYTATGTTTLDDEQLPARIDIAEQMRTARFSWSQDTQTLYCVCDDVVLCWTDRFGWSVWSFQVHGKTIDLRPGAPSLYKVTGYQNIKAPVVVPVGAELYLIGGPDDVNYQADDLAGRTITVEDLSCYLLKLGRGGALDRSIDVDLEDEREPHGGWKRVEDGTNTPDEPAIFIGKPVVLPAGFRLYDSGTGGTPTTETTYWLPISLDKGTAYGSVYNPATAIVLSFLFDNTAWRAVCGYPGNANPNALAIVVPNERLASKAAFGIGGGPGLAVAFPDLNGNRINLNIIGPPDLNTGPVGMQPLVWVGFKRAPGATESSFGIVDGIVNHAVTDALAVVQAQVYVWQGGVYPVEQEALEDLTQSVDWVAKTAEFAMRGLQFKVRGLLLETQHLGKQTGADAINTSWGWGPLNTATSTDLRDYCGQAIDFAAAQPGNSAATNLLSVARLMPTGGTAIVRKVAGAGPTWGEASTTKGNLLVDDPPIDTLGTTDGSQGERGSVMVHGTLSGPAENVRMSKVEAVVVAIGKARRG